MSKRSILLKWVLLLGAVGILVVFISVFVAGRSESGIPQPIAYSHKLHIESAGLTCEHCHGAMEKVTSPVIPALAICRDCHSDTPLSESPEEKKLLDYVSKGKEIPWQRVYSVPDYVFFSHRRHVVKGELQCDVCHGNMSERTTPVSSVFLPLTMDNCMKCHKLKKVTNDCLSCHR